MTSLYCRFAYFTTESAQQGRKTWLRTLSRSLGKHTLYSFATETQIQEYLMGKYEDFLKKAEEMHWPIKIACKAVGLQCVSDEEAESVDYETSEKVWVLNRDMVYFVSSEYPDAVTIVYVPQPDTAIT